MLAHDTRHRNRRGFTLTELAIVLGVIGTILAAIWSAASTVYIHHRVDIATRQILTIASGVRGMFPRGSVPATNLAPLLINSGVVPNDMISACSGQFGATWGGAAGCAFTPWNAQIAIDSQEGWLGAPASVNAFEILIDTLTQSQCASFLPSFVQAAAGNGLTYVAVDNSGGGTAVATAVTAATPITTFSNCGGEIVLQFSLTQ